jgi:hypothetical protein
MKPHFLLILFLFLPAGLFAGSLDHNIIDTPKAYVPYRGDLSFGFSVYDGGGILTSTSLSVSDYALLGIYFDAGNFIGDERVSVSPPGVIARFLITEGTYAFPAVALGWSYFMKGEAAKVDDTIVSGVYLAVSHRFYMFGNEQNFSYGARYPVVPLDRSDPENFSVFLGTDIEFSPAFSIQGEVENIRFVRDGWETVFYNFGFSFSMVEMVTLKLEFKYSPSIDDLVRHLTVGYHTQF